MGDERNEGLTEFEQPRFVLLQIKEIRHGRGMGKCEMMQESTEEALSPDQPCETQRNGTSAQSVMMMMMMSDT